MSDEALALWTIVGFLVGVPLGVFAAYLLLEWEDRRRWK